MTMGSQSEHSSADQAKICVLCQQDCHDRPRIRDNEGRYFCKACLIRRKAKQLAEQIGKAESDRNAVGSETQAIDSSLYDDKTSSLHDNMVPGVVDESTLDPYEVDIDDDPNALTPIPGFYPIPVDLVEQEAPRQSCPVCKRSLHADARICVGCGYDKAKGIQSSTRIEKTTRHGRRGLFCEHCGYDMEGLPEPICPECGTPIDFSRRHRLMEGYRVRGMPDEYRKPLVWFLVGFILTASIQGAIHGLAGVIEFAVGFALTLPALYVGLWLCKVVWLGREGTIMLDIMHLAGALALYSLVNSVFPFGFVVLTVGPRLLTPGLFVFAAVLMDVLEIDLHDAIIVGIVMGAVVVISNLGVWYLMTYIF